MLCVVFQTVEKTELIGIEYLWELCLNVLDPDIAELAISLMMHMSYSSLSPRLKRVRITFVTAQN